MKYIVLPLFFLLFAYLNAQVISISFSAVNAKNGISVTPDSIRIINKDWDIDTTIYSLRFTYQDLIGVSDNIMEQEGIKEITNITGKLITLSVNTQQYSNLKINIFDLLGNCITTYNNDITPGIYFYDCYANALPAGVYFINATNGKYNFLTKFISSGNNLSGNTEVELSGRLIAPNENINNIIIKASDFTFISYKQNYYNDTLNKLKPSNNDEIKFILKPLSGWKYTLGSMDIHGVSYKYRTIYSQYTANPNDYKIDTTYNDNNLGAYDIHVCQLGYPYWPGHPEAWFLPCNIDSSTSNKGVFCCQSNSADYECKTELTEVSLDTINQKIDKISFHYYRRYLYKEFGDDDIKENFNFYIYNIPFKIKDGILISELNGIKNESIFISYNYSQDYKPSLSSACHNIISGESISKEVKNDASIVIKLYP